MIINLQFRGGTELLFHKTEDTMTLDDTTNPTISDLIGILSRKLEERVELFSVDEKRIRPGILILVNDSDYEILGGHKYKLKHEDTILFISTLHGG